MHQPSNHNGFGLKPMHRCKLHRRSLQHMLMRAHPVCHALQWHNKHNMVDGPWTHPWRARPRPNPEEVRLGAHPPTELIDSAFPPAMASVGIWPPRGLPGGIVAS